jgi:glycosyltransferase involved in cell wall biosynthesis
MNNMSIYLSVVIPSYNEMRNIKRGVLDEVYQFLKDYSQNWELILSDDGSTDGTKIALSEFAKKDKRIKFLANPHRGKGPTVSTGMMAAQGQWRLYADFDQSTPLKEVNSLFKYSDQYQVIFGSREIIGAQRQKEPFYRHLMGRVFNLLVQTLAVPGMLDTQCGFKLFSQKATVALFPKLFVYSGKKERGDAFTGAFDVELLYLAKKYQFKIREVPVVWKHHATDRVNPIKDSVLMLLDILRIKMADFSGKYPNHA